MPTGKSFKQPVHLLPIFSFFGKDLVLKALGAEVIRCPSAPFGTPGEFGGGVRGKGLGVEILTSSFCLSFFQMFTKMVPKSWP